MHGGTVEAASDGENAGSTFRVRLPLMIVHPAGARGAARASADDVQRAARTARRPRAACAWSPSTTKRTRSRCCGWCSRRPAPRCRPSRLPRRPSRTWRAERPDVLVVDLGMPEMDGYDFIRRLRASADPSVRDVPAAALTAFARAEDRTRALQSGFEMHLAKPVDPGELVASVATLVRRARVPTLIAAHASSVSSTALAAGARRRDARRRSPCTRSRHRARRRRRRGGRPARADRRGWRDGARSRRAALDCAARDSTMRSAASGPSTSATATARLSATIGVGVTASS